MGESKKILFLDIDGVVNNPNTKQKHGPFRGIDPKLAKIVKRIIKETKCDVVLSSTWRLDEDSREHVREKVCDFIDRTYDSKSGHRGDEIIEWLNRNGNFMSHDYAILDDDSDFYAWQPLFRTDHRTGITEEIADKVIAHLRRRG